MNSINASKGNSIKLVKEANKYLILQCIMKFAPISTEDIVKRTSLSRPTVLNVIHDLTEELLVVRDGFSKSTGGRAPGLWGLNRDDHFAVGIDFEFPQVRMVITNMKNEIRASRTLSYPQDIDAAVLLDSLHRELDSFIDLSGVRRDAIDGVGMGLSGVIDTVNGISSNIERISGWNDIHIQQDLEEYLQMPVYIKNDVHLMGLVEKRLYLGDLNDFIYIGLRSGIGSIVYQQGRPMRGEKGNAGFIGHTTLDPRGPQCCCGSRGCLDVYSSKLAVLRAYATKCEEAHIPAPADAPDFDQLIAQSAAGDELSREVLHDAGFYLGVAIANMVKTLEIPKVVVGGSPSLKDSVYLKAAEAAMKEYLTETLDVHVSLSCGELPEEKYALGGCLLVFDHLFSKPKLSLSMV